MTVFVEQVFAALTPLRKAVDPVNIIKVIPALTSLQLVAASRLNGHRTICLVRSQVPSRIKKGKPKVPNATGNGEG